MYQKTLLINILTLAFLVGWSGSLQARTPTISRAAATMKRHDAVQKKTEKKTAKSKEPASRPGFFEIKFDGNFLVITRKDDLKAGYMAPCEMVTFEGDPRENFGTAIGTEIQRRRTRSNPIGVAALSRGNLNDCRGLMGLPPVNFCETATGIGLPQQGPLRGARGILSGFGSVQVGNNLAGLDPSGSGPQFGFGAQGSFGGGARDAFGIGNLGGSGRDAMGLSGIANAGLSLWEPCGGQSSQCGNEGGGGASGGSISEASIMSETRFEDQSGWAMDGGRTRHYEEDVQTDSGRTYHVEFEEDDNGNYSVEVSGTTSGGESYLYANDGNFNGQREARTEIEEDTGEDLIGQAEGQAERERSAESADRNARQSQPGSGGGQPAAGEAEDPDDCSGDNAGSPECEPTDGGTEPGGTGDGDGDTYPNCEGYYSEECGAGSNTIVFPLPINQPYVDPSGGVIDPSGDENTTWVDPEDLPRGSMDDPLGPWINPTNSNYGSGSAEGSEGAGCGGQGGFNGPAGYTDPASDPLIQSSGDEESVVGIDPDDDDDGGDEDPGS